MFQRNISGWVLVCIYVFSLNALGAQEKGGSAAQQPQAAQQAAAAVVAEPEAPRVVLQAETTASVLRLMKFSGLLLDRAGNPRTGAASLTFALYKDQQGGSPLWLEVHNAQLDEQGRYTVLLGSTKSDGLPLELFSSGEARWLGVQLNLPGEEEQPRVLLVSVPYALKAADAETLGGKPPSAFLLAEPVGADLRVRPGADKAESAKEAVKEGPTRQAVQTLNFVQKQGASALEDSSIFDNGNVGISTTSPAAKLSVGNGSIADANVPVQISTGGPGSITYFGANKGGGYGLLFGYEYGGSLGTGGVLRLVPPDPLLFFVNSSTEAMRITSTGNLGIGTVGPQAKLSVGSGSLLDTNVPVQISTGGSGSVTYYGANKNGGYGLLLGYENGGGLGTGGVLRMVSADPLLFFVNNTAEAMRITSTGNVGIGTAAPAQKLDVSTNTGSMAVRGTHTAGSGTTFGVYGVSDSTDGRGVRGWATAGSGTTYGVYGESFSTDGRGVFGLAFAGSGTTYGVYGQSNSTDGLGVFGRATAASGFTFGVLGQSDSTSGTGVFGTATGTGLTYGGFFQSASTDGRGVYGAASASSGTTYGVYGQSNSASGYGVYSQGNAHVTGKLTVSGNVGIGTTSKLSKLTVQGTPSFSASGTVSVAGSSATVTGNGTIFLTQVGVGDRIQITTNCGPETKIITAIASDTSLTVNSAFCGIASGVAMTVFPGLFRIDDGSGGTKFMVSDLGNVGIGDLNPANILTVMQSSATDPIADAWTVYSSRRWKTNIRPLAGALDKVQRLRGVCYERKADGRHDIGVIAEEVGQVVPEVVAYEENGQDAKSVDYARLTALLIEAVKEQQAQIRQLQLQVEQLKGRGSKAVAFARR